MKKRIISKGMKVFMTILLTVGIGCYISAAVVLYNSDYKISNYYNEIRSMFYLDEFYYGEHNKIETVNSVIDANISSINISTNNTSINLEIYEGSELKVELYRNIFIREEGFNNIGFRRNSGSEVLEVIINEQSYLGDMLLKVYVPKSYSKNINVSSNTGDVKMLDLTIDNTSIKSNSGDVKLHSVTLNNLDLKTNTSDVEVNNSTFKTSKVDMVSGSFEMSGDIGEGSIVTQNSDVELDLRGLRKNLSITSDSGDVELNIALGIPYSVEFLSRYGEMQCNNKFYNDRNTFNSFTEGSGENKITVNVKNGDINIR